MNIEHRIILIRGQKVMLDNDLAELYGVPTKRLNEAVSRNLERFPEDFMFQLNPLEHQSLRCQIGTLKRGQHRKYQPRAFTEQGVAMLSSVLRSQKAVQVNIRIMRAFVQLRQVQANQPQEIRVIFDDIRQLMRPSPVRKTRRRRRARLLKIVTTLCN